MTGVTWVVSAFSWVGLLPWSLPVPENNLEISDIQKSSLKYKELKKISLKAEIPLPTVMAMYKVYLNSNLLPSKTDLIAKLSYILEEWDVGKVLGPPQWNCSVQLVVMQCGKWVGREKIQPQSET